VLQFVLIDPFDSSFDLFDSIFFVWLSCRFVCFVSSLLILDCLIRHYIIYSDDMIMLLQDDAKEEEEDEDGVVFEETNAACTGE
jgi:hypothetical protein